MVNPSSYLLHEILLKNQIKFDSKIVKNIKIKTISDISKAKKDYITFLNLLNCNNIILLVGNHCNRGKLQSALLECNKLIYLGDYLELNIDKQIVCCSHFPMFN